MDRLGLLLRGAPSSAVVPRDPPWWSSWLQSGGWLHQHLSTVLPSLNVVATPLAGGVLAGALILTPAHDGVTGGAGGSGSAGMLAASAAARPALASPALRGAARPAGGSGSATRAAHAAGGAAGTPAGHDDGWWWRWQHHSSSSWWPLPQRPPGEDKPERSPVSLTAPPQPQLPGWLTRLWPAPNN
jgi:hypothetical protein